MKDILSDKLQVITDHIKKLHKVVITCFQPDQKKSGGVYVTVIGTVKKIDDYIRTVVMTDGTEILIEEIINIEG